MLHSSPALVSERGVFFLVVRDCKLIFPFLFVSDPYCCGLLGVRTHLSNHLCITAKVVASGTPTLNAPPPPPNDFDCDDDDDDDPSFFVLHLPSQTSSSSENCQADIDIGNESRANQNWRRDGEDTSENWKDQGWRRDEVVTEFNQEWRRQDTPDDKNQDWRRQIAKRSIHSSPNSRSMPRLSQAIPRGENIMTRRSLKVGQAEFKPGGNLSFVPVSGFRLADLPIMVASNSTSGVANLPPACVRVLAWPLQK